MDEHGPFRGRKSSYNTFKPIFQADCDVLPLPPDRIAATLAFFLSSRHILADESMRNPTKAGLQGPCRTQVAWARPVTGTALLRASVITLGSVGASTRLPKPRAGP